MEPVPLFICGWSLPTRKGDSNPTWSLTPVAPLLQEAWFESQANKRVQVWCGWAGWEVQRERERGAGNITVGTGQPVFLISAGLCHSSRVGPPLSGPQLQRKELIPPLQLCRDHQEGKKEWRQGKWWYPWIIGRGTEVYSEDTNRNQNTEPPEIWINVSGHANWSSGLERGDASVLGSWKSCQWSSDGTWQSGDLMGPDPSRSGPRCHRQCVLQ